MSDLLSVAGHRLEVVDVWLAGPEPVVYRRSVEPEPTSGHWERYWRCRDCGVERGRPDEVPPGCPGLSGTDRSVLADD